MYGEKIKELREQKRISQEVMAEKLHISQSAYSKYESNQVQVSVDMLLRIAETLEVSPMEILKKEGNTINFHNGSTSSISNGALIIESFYNHSKELFDTALQAKDQVINSLQEQVKMLKEEVQRQQSKTK